MNPGKVHFSRNISNVIASINDSFDRLQAAAVIGNAHPPLTLL
jgi:hypothetical protein